MQQPRTVLITGADRGLGLSVAKGLAKLGWRVFAGRILAEYTLLDDLKKEYPEVYPVKLDVTQKEDVLSVKDQIEKTSGKLDMIVSNAALMGGNAAATVGGEKPIDFDALALSFRTNSMAAVLLTEVMLPLLEKSDYKRLFFVSSEISSVGLMRRVGDMRYAMSKTALNLGVRMLFNELRPQGYTFRLFQPGWMKHVRPDGTRAEGAMVDPDDSAEEAIRQMLADRIDEDRLVLVDYLGHELSF